jgi:hypothetical protein
MGAWSIRFIRSRDQARLAKLLGPKDTLLAADGSPFTGVRLGQPTFEPQDLATLSSAFGEVVAFAVQTVADLVLYDHWVAGARVRGLTFAGEAGWVRVVGSPEPWEKPFLFSATRFAELLSELEEDCTDEEMLTRDSDELRRLWGEAELEEGNPCPPVQLSGLLRAVTCHFGISTKL